MKKASKAEPPGFYFDKNLRKKKKSTGPRIRELPDHSHVGTSGNHSWKNVPVKWETLVAEMMDTMGHQIFPMEQDII